VSLTTEICWVLRKPVVRQLGFRVPRTNWVLHAHQFEDVARAIDRGRIIVMENLRLARAGLARYTHNRNGQNLLEVPWPHPSRLGAQANLIHEMVHAVQDWNRRVIDELDDEATAYIAQFLYFRRVTGADWIAPQAWHTDPALQQLGAVGYFIAVAISNRRMDLVTAGVVTQMRQALVATGQYAGGRTKVYDGI
jgi:hypothetical protein